MNIGELYYCSRCMHQLEEEQKCPFCGYDGNEEQDLSALPEGTLLQNGRYELGAVVGIGGFGITYAAWDHILQIPAAIKEYFPQAFAERNTDETDDVSIKKDQQAFYRIGYDKFLKEAHILGTLQNMKSVVAVRDWFEKNNTAYIAMEFIHGSTIDRYVKRHNITEKRILEMLKQTIQELGQIHQLGILHRDISPGNLIVEDDGNIKLIDFGSAIDLGQRRDGRTNTVMYNPDFAAPEQYDPNGHIGPWTDVYGISAVIFYLLTGETISKGKEVQKQPNIPRWQKDILMRGLSPSVESRVQSMTEFYARLYDAPLPEEIRKQEEQRKRQRKVILFGGIAAILLNVNCWYGLPLGDGYRYQLNYDGFHVEGVTDNWYYNTIPATRLGIPVSDIDVTALSIDSRGKFTVPGSIRTIGRQAFYSCGFEYIEMEDGVEYIGEKAFASTKRLQGVYIPESVTMIEDSAFDSNKESLVIWGERHSEAERFAAAKGIAFATADEFLYNPETSSLEKYLGNEEKVMIPTTFMDEGYIYDMSSEVFSGCDNMKSIVLPDMLRIVPTGLLANQKSLEKVSIGYATQEIEAEAFANSGLIQVELPEFLAYIDEKAFYQCELRSVELPKGMLEIGESAFDGCTNLKDVWVLSYNCAIAESAFQNGSADLTIHGLPGSTAETYAQKHGYHFVVIKEIN